MLGEEDGRFDSSQFSERLASYMLAPSAWALKALEFYSLSPNYM